MEVTPIIIWWLISLLFGLAGWPLAFSLLRHLPDRGFAFARPVGLLFTGYLLWLGGTFRLLQNNLSGILIALLIILIAGLVWQWREITQHDSPTLATWPMVRWLKREWPYVLTVEILFGLAFVSWVIFKSYNPNIETAGGEKWMEIAFINGTLRSDYFPPQDPWLAGFTISYYYFGYVLMAMMTQLSGLIPTTAFNLYVPTLFALTLTAAYGVVANLVSLYQTPQMPTAPEPTTSRLNLPACLTGLIGALFVGFLGNLIGLFEVLHKRGLLPADFWIWLDIRDLKIPPVGPSDSWLPDRFIWWWRGSRVLTDYNLAGQEQEVIDEFPFFSFLLGDVHPHVLALPFVLLVVALALNLLVNRSTDEPTEASLPSSNQPSTIDKIREFLHNTITDLLTATGGRLPFLLYAIAIGSLGFLNTWDFPIYLMVTGLALIAWLAARRDDWQAAILPGIISTGILAVVSVLLYVPFYATFQSQAGGLLPNLWNPTRLPQFLVFFGTFIVAVIGLLLALSRQRSGWQTHLSWTLPLTIGGPVVVMLFVIGLVWLSPRGWDYVQGILNNPQIQTVIGGADFSDLLQTSFWRRLTNPWTFLLLGGLLGWTAALLVNFSQADKTDRLPEKFGLILLVMGLLLPLSVEFVYLRDNFGIRMNTIFKFYFQAWVLLALASAFAVFYVNRNLPKLPALIWNLALGLCVAAGMIYPTLATADKTNYFNNEPTLNGIAWVANHHPDDYAAIQWLRANAPDNAVILEAPGSGYAAYQYTGRISALTGIPTLLGWGGHQSQWRGNYEEPARREPDIDRLYNTLDPQQTQELLEKYDITYVYVGPLERQRYAQPGLNKFPHLMDVAFEQGDVVIYKRR